MTENVNQDSFNNAASGSGLSLQAVGRILVEAREKAGLSVDEVASRLRLTPKQVLALEAGNMEALPGAAFVRGFLRNYARLLELDPEPLLEACRSHGYDVAQRKISLNSENIPIAGGQRKVRSGLLLAVLALIVVSAGWFAYQDFSSRPSSSAPTPPAEEVVPQSVPGEFAPLPQVLPLEPVAPVPAAPAGPAATEQPAAPPAQELGAKLTLSTKQASWISVTDRDGQQLFNKTLPAGTSETITGTPPFRLVLGNAAEVEVAFNGNPVDLTPHIKGNVARLTLE